MAEQQATNSLFDRVSDDLNERILIQTQRSAHPWIGVATRTLLSLPLQLRGEARRYAAGIEGESVNVLTIGREGTLNLHGRVLGEVGQSQQLGSRGLWSPKKLHAHSPDLVISEIHRLAAPRFRKAGWIVVPHAVRWKASLASIPPPKPSRSLTDDLRRVRNRGFALERAESRRDWDEFFSQMVIPLARERFGCEAWFATARLRRDLASLATLLFVHTTEGRVAGIALMRDARTPWVVAIGVKAGDRRLVREGALAAAYFAVIELARHEGCDQIDFGRTSPFLNDGLHRYKRKWGMAPVVDRIVQLSAVWLDPDREVLRRAFARQPVIVEADGRLDVFAG